jgi:hypothetical protein
MLGADQLRRGVKVGKPKRRKPRGTVLVLAAFLMVVMLAILALSVDLGYMMVVRTELKRATDAAALAGAGVLIDGPEGAQANAMEYIARNPIGGKLVAEQEGWLEQLQQLITEEHGEIEVQVGHWDPDSPQSPEDLRFTQSDYMPSTIRVASMHQNAPLFFAGIFGRDRFTVTEESIARYQPRDIALVLDFSGSMNDDSELKSIGWDGSNRETVEADLLQIYQDLGSTAYGDLQFQPQYLTVVGQPPASPEMAQISVTFRSSDVQVNSNKDLSNVVLQFSDGSMQKFEDLSGYTGEFQGTGEHAGKRIDVAWVKSGSNESGDCPGCGERFEDTHAVIKETFGLDTTPYPYPSGSWDDYINYVKSSYNVHRAGYRKMYGHMTLINYWLEKKPRHDETPDLWMADAQPVGAVKDAVGVFMDYVQEVDTEDRIGLVVYNSASEEALIEHSLTEDFATVENTVEHRQAGHYNVYTNIGAGIGNAVGELQANARTGAFKMIVLMTDGMANRPSDARNYALQQAGAAAALRYPIVTISLGDNADTALMEQIADMTDGAHFRVPVGSSVEEYHEAIKEVFRQIAKERPLVLVK